MLQVHTQGIAEWVERWSFVTMGEDMGYMHFKKKYITMTGMSK